VNVQYYDLSHQEVTFCTSQRMLMPSQCKDNCSPGGKIVAYHRIHDSHLQTDRIDRDQIQT